jgi:transcriptional regulator with XRE-family HTH domain
MDGAKLKHWRLARTMTIRDLAARSGVDHSAISLIERGKRHPHPSTIRKLAEALGVEPRELLEGADTGKAAAWVSTRAAFGTPSPAGFSVG